VGFGGMGKRVLGGLSLSVVSVTQMIHVTYCVGCASRAQHTLSSMYNVWLLT
jgi:hypothetical protein